MTAQKLIRMLDPPPKPRGAVTTCCQIAEERAALGFAETHSRRLRSVGEYSDTFVPKNVAPSVSAPYHVRFSSVSAAYHLRISKTGVPYTIAPVVQDGRVLARAVPPVPH